MTSAIGWVTACGVLGAIVANTANGEPSSLHPRVRMETTLGPIVIELDGEKSPRTVSNFVSYVETHFFDGTIFHRVLEGGLIQGGAFDATMERRTDGLRDGVKCESNNGLLNERGTIAMYRASGFPDSAKAEFFINVRDSPNLDMLHRDGRAYTVFGAVVEGLDEIDKIAAVPVGTHAKYARGRSQVVPTDPVVIKSMRMLSAFDHHRALTMADAEDMRLKKIVEDAVVAEKDALRDWIKSVEAQSGQEMVTADSGLGYIVMRAGHGAPPIESETVTVHYRGMLSDGSVFEETYRSETAEPLTQQVSRFISGLREGILGMNEGGKRFFVVPPELGFGVEGVPERIPPDSTLYYEVELLAIENE